MKLTRILRALDRNSWRRVPIVFGAAGIAISLLFEVQVVTKPELFRGSLGLFLIGVAERLNPGHPLFGFFLYIGGLVLMVSVIWPYVFG